jgi:hypothetical protein
MSNPCTNREVTRRAMLGEGVLLLAGGSCVLRSLAARAANSAEDSQPALRIGLVTDIHYADKKEAGSRFYRQSLAKLDQCLAHFQEASVDFAVELGDFIDLAGSVEEEIRHLKTVEERFSQFAGERHYVLGNHCVDGLNKKEFFANCSARRPYYSFDHGPFHFINEHKQVGGIHYCTLTALVEGSGLDSNAFATADLFPDGSLRIHGFSRQAHHELASP